MKKRITGVVGFVNVMDLHDYLGDATITIQTVMGLQYVENFLGYDVVFLLSDDEIPAGTVVATAKNNIVCYFVDPENEDFRNADLVYTTSGELNMIGFATKPDYDTASSNSYAIMGIVLFAEYIDAIAVATKASTEVPFAVAGEEKS